MESDIASKMFFPNLLFQGLFAISLGQEAGVSTEGGFHDQAPLGVGADPKDKVDFEDKVDQGNLFEADANLPSCPSEEGKNAQGGGDNGELSPGSLPKERHGRQASSPGKQSKGKRQCGGIGGGTENCYKLKLCNYYEGCRCGGRGKCISSSYRNCFDDQGCQENIKACTLQNPCVCIDRRRDSLGYRRFIKGVQKRSSFYRTSGTCVHQRGGCTPGSYLVKKSPDYNEYPDYPVPDYECQRIDDIDAEYYDEKGCHPPCSVRWDPAGTYCDIYDFEVVMKPSNNQTTG